MQNTARQDNKPHKKEIVSEAETTSFLFGTKCLMYMPATGKNYFFVTS